MSDITVLPAYKYECDCGTSFRVYHGVHSCLPKCNACGVELTCINDNPRSGCCGYRIYIRAEDGVAYCPWCRKDIKMSKDSPRQRTIREDDERAPSRTVAARERKLELERAKAIRCGHCRYHRGDNRRYTSPHANVRKVGVKMDRAQLRRLRAVGEE